MSQEAASQALSIVVDGGTATPLKLFLLLTALSFLPALLLSMTSFARVLIVLGFLRQALGTQQLPPNQILVGIALFLSLLVMSPTLDAVWSDGLRPFLDDEIGWQEAGTRAERPLKEFMLRQTRESDLSLFFDVARAERPSARDASAIPLRVVVPAFMVSELTTAFTMGLRLFLPLLVVDLLVSAILMSLGMMMVPPSMISLPVKIGVFVLADGWALVVGTLARSFG